MRSHLSFTEAKGGFPPGPLDVHMMNRVCLTCGQGKSLGEWHFMDIMMISSSLPHPPSSLWGFFGVSLGGLPCAVWAFLASGINRWRCQSRTFHQHWLQWLCFSKDTLGILYDLFVCHQESWSCAAPLKLCKYSATLSVSCLYCILWVFFAIDRNQ